MDKKTAEIFYKIIEEEITEQDIKHLFNYCVKIAEIYARSSSKVTGKNLERWNNTLKDLASDSVTPLFINNCNDKLFLKQSYENWASPIKDDGDIDFFLHRVVWKSVEQKITALLKESDPFFAKILKTISVGIAKNDYKKINFFGTVYIIPDPQNEIEGPVIPPEEMWEIPQKYFLKKQKKLLDGLILYITENTNYFPAIPLNELIKRVKNLYLSNNIHDNSLDDYEIIEIKDFLKTTNKNIQNKIIGTYLQKNKLNDDEIKKIIGIFKSISSDLMNGGMNGNLIDYFEEFFPETAKDEYYSKYQKILNYLYKIYRSELAEKLK